MIFPSNRVRVLVSTQPVDFRKGHDGLCALVASTLRKDPYTGTVFVFRARRAVRMAGEEAFHQPRSFAKGMPGPKLRM